MLLAIAVVVLVAGFGAAIASWSRAPAVSLALTGGIAGGLAGFAFSWHNDVRQVPADVAIWATCGLVGSGLLGLLVTPRGPSQLLRHAATVVLMLVPFAATALAAALLEACPLYTRRGFCYHEIDVLGGWITGVVALFVTDIGALAILLLVSARLAEGAELSCTRSGTRGDGLASDVR